MTVLRENLVLDLHYASETTFGEKVAKLTVVLRDNTTGTEVHTSTLVREGEGESAVYTVGYQNISNATDPLLLKLEAYFRTADKTMFDKLMTRVDTLFTSDLNSNSTWMGQYGLRIVSSAMVDEFIPESVFE
ncbi:TPA: hypothetical protein NV896_002048 [Escherichia coli]|uniref:hypothetical protein n=1 Tax=Escherichia coli TaxID=562 RepID=UPI001BC11FB5|nr:hypothetical protein [Escherichia coli]EIF8836116.1 hypothetical protein [Escherichia coli]EKP8440770.1 hypothetical protein [Escherichia coli]MCK2808432.1 hypothetical protein [Escherichia coli]MCL7121600.1 hypothetical protein [Escherichia coli]UOY77550.1 hypothetical protein MWN27_25540 [Escherichia coli]